MCKAINHRQESYAFYLLYHTNNFFLIVHKITLPVCKLLPTLKYMLDQQMEYHELMFALYPIICLIKRNKWDEMIFPRGNCQWYTGIFTIAQKLFVIAKVKSFLFGAKQNTSIGICCICFVTFLLTVGCLCICCSEQMLVPLFVYSSTHTGELMM